jgi:hypothetical protein
VERTLANDDNVTSFIDRLEARAEEEHAFFVHMDRIKSAIPIVAAAIERTRREVPGITDAELAGVLTHAADELGGVDDRDAHNTA